MSNNNAPHQRPRDWLDERIFEADEIVLPPAQGRAVVPQAGTAEAWAQQVDAAYHARMDLRTGHDMTMDEMVYLSEQAAYIQQVKGPEWHLIGLRRKYETYSREADARITRFMRRDSGAREETVTFQATRRSEGW